jgi:UDP-N-acetyl-D-mannosaminuronate dehydrogenase
MKIAVIGLGYVGLPLSLQFARSCTEVIGIDVDPTKVELLNKGQSYIKHVSEAGIRELVDQGKFVATTDFSRIREVEAVIICVPTPLNKNREPNLSYVLETGRSIAPYLKSGEADLKMGDGRSKIEGRRLKMGDGRSKIEEAGSRTPHPHPLPDRSGEGEAMAGPISELPASNSELRKLIVLESTTYPGTTEEELRAVLEENSPYVDDTTPDDRRRTTEDGTAELSGQWSVVSGQQSPKRRMRAGVDFHLAFSPEREDPANDQSKVKSIPKVVGGYTPACLERAVALYRKYFPQREYRAG